MMNQLVTATRFALLSFRRNPAASFFTVVLPVMFLMIFGFLFGSETMNSGADAITFLVPGIIVLSIVSATFVNLAITTTFKRELGQLKRIRSTPMPPVVYIGAQVIASIVIAIVMTVLMVLIGWLVFGVSFNANHFGVFALTLLLGAGAFAALGLAITTVIPSQDAAPAVTNFIVLPLYFFSDVFIISDNPPAFMNFIGNLFPIKHAVKAMQDTFNPFVTSVSVPWGHWAVIAAWGIAGVVIAATTFRWTPQRSG